MKIFLILALAVSFSIGLYAADQNSAAGSGIKNEAKATEFKKAAENDNTDAKKEETKGNKELADAYKKSAAAKTKMSEAYSSGDSDALKKANIENVNAENEVDRIQKGIKKDKPPKAQPASKKKLVK